MSRMIRRLFWLRRVPAAPGGSPGSTTMTWSAAAMQWSGADMTWS